MYCLKTGAKMSHFIDFIELLHRRRREQQEKAISYDPEKV